VTCRTTSVTSTHPHTAGGATHLGSPGECNRLNWPAHGFPGERAVPQPPTCWPAPWRRSSAPLTSVVIDTPPVDTTLRVWPGGAARSLLARGRWSRPPRVRRAARGVEGTGRAVFAPLPVVTIVCADAPAPGRPSIPHTPEGVLSNAVQRGWPYLFSRRSTVTSLINLS
jgi:hypothetical protein